jgi:Cu/Ag efflux pump CusA
VHHASQHQPSPSRDRRPHAAVRQAAGRRDLRFWASVTVAALCAALVPLVAAVGAGSTGALTRSVAAVVIAGLAGVAVRASAAAVR